MRISLIQSHHFPGGTRAIILRKSRVRLVHPRSSVRQVVRVRRNVVHGLLPKQSSREQAASDVGRLQYSLRVKLYPDLQPAANFKQPRWMQPEAAKPLRVRKNRYQSSVGQRAQVTSYLVDVHLSGSFDQYIVRPVQCGNPTAEQSRNGTGRKQRLSTLQHVQQIAFVPQYCLARQSRSRHSVRSNAQTPGRTCGVAKTVLMPSLYAASSIAYIISCVPAPSSTLNRK